MTDINLPLSRLGLSQYAERFIEEGFDSWQAILHITESDLDHLGVKLGHRRVLQTEIAYARGLSVEQLSSPTKPHPPEDNRVANLQDGARLDGHLDGAPRGKRKYRRHPKNDEHAPERPPSAYVIFSNKIREELKPQNLSFTEIAKRVGERWQTITPEEKGPHEKLAMELKDKYHKEMNAYKTTEQYRNYMEYMADFKLKYSTSSDVKKPRLEQEDSRDSNGSNESQGGTESTEYNTILGGSAGESRHRVDSSSSAGRQQMTGEFPSPASITSRQLGPRGGLATILPHSSVSPNATSPSSPSVRRDSSNGPMPGAMLLPRPVRESAADLTSYSGVSQRMHRSSPYGDGETDRGSLGPSIDPRLSRSHENHSPLDEQRHSARPVPKLIHQNTSSSSNISTGSGISAASTGASSIHPVNRSAEEIDRPQLPPLAATSLHKPGGNMADYALRSSQPKSSGATPPNGPPQNYQPLLSGPSSLSGMNFESLQLPVPYNLPFGQEHQLPLPRPDKESRLANVFDLQDIPPIGPFRNVTLQQGAEQQSMGPLSQSLESRNSPLQPLQPVLPSLRPGISAIPRDSLSQGPGIRLHEDRLAFLADVARADQDRRSGS